MSGEDEITKGWVEGTIRGIANICYRWKTRSAKKRDLIKTFRNSKYQWLSIERLQCSVRGVDDEELRTLLREIGARPSELGKEVWTLKKD